MVNPPWLLKMIELEMKMVKELFLYFLKKVVNYLLITYVCHK